eukprot:c11956_g1_i1 orf=246-689(-)
MAMASLSEVVAIACFIMLMSSCSHAGRVKHGRKVIVGGEEHWRFGYNYSEWAMKAGPFHVGDTLVFMYKPSTFNGMEVNHNVYSLHSVKAYEQCSFGRGVLLGNTTQGDPGVEFTLTVHKKPVYFACGIAQGIHCNQGLMKFCITPR